MRANFPAYRRFSNARVEINDAMMALLIGARLGEHALKTSAAEEHVLLPAIFGRIEGIDRLNRTSGDAADLLRNAETHLAYMAIPYTLTVHSTFLVAAARMVRAAGRDREEGDWTHSWLPDLSKLGLEGGHQYIEERCGWRLDQRMLQLFNLARRIRNRIVHAGGDVGSRLLGEYRSLPDDVRNSWERLSGRSLTKAVVDDRMRLLEGEIVAVLAISRHLGQEVNNILCRTLDRSFWAGVVVNDYRKESPQRFGERDRRGRRIYGHAQRFYGSLDLTPDELEPAIARALEEGGSSY